MSQKEVRLLYQLARLYGVQTAYYDYSGKRKPVPVQSLLAVLQALGAPLASLSEVTGALRERRQELWKRYCEPVVVVWSGEPCLVKLRLPADEAESKAHLFLELEHGETQDHACSLGEIPALERTEVEGTEYLVKQLTLDTKLPLGYHRLKLVINNKSWETLVIVAPKHVFTGFTRAVDRVWGTFLPLYALHTERSWGAGDFSDLRTLMHWVKELGGEVVGTLPLLATYLDEPFDPSPYAPISRLFWNEFYLDATDIPELKQCPTAQELINSSAFQQELAVLRNASLVDYRRLMAIKRRVLEHLTCCFFQKNSQRRTLFHQWLQSNPKAEDYARFRATTEKQRAGWPDWPQQMRDGLLREGEYDADAVNYHLYVQWLVQEQLHKIAAEAKNRGPMLYLDLPLGVHRAGYDVWRERPIFVLEASAGAPPDLFFSKGQDWGTPPLHPEQLREHGYHYFIDSLKNHLQHATILRIDHIMGFHRLFWVPKGLEAVDGVYVRYHAEEFYAILALESHRWGVLIVGEDLGTVPRYIQAAIARHKVQKMYILPFEFTGKHRYPLRPVPGNSLAALNTHDMLPFAAFWEQRNPQEKLALTNFLHQSGYLESPTEKVEDILRGCLKFLAASRARVVLVNLEDLWQETEPQNLPGTELEHPNWKRKARFSYENFSKMPQVLQLLQEVDKLRKKTNSQPRQAKS
ncbi:MAG: 4-alpha-glucanotransferase [Thermoanaerobacterales bacterium 50_218]|nr:MAG: 4-alpha-glucanotransferase [Thermoanaerobacterales bacterium 50_218]HAA90707.1 4-alpha-glucanotransferase [Peptococcaceae bacterium]